jgi:hypothetical protein
VKAPQGSSGSATANLDSKKTKTKKNELEKLRRCVSWVLSGKIHFGNQSLKAV